MEAHPVRNGCASVFNGMRFCLGMHLYLFTNTLKNERMRHILWFILLLAPLAHAQEQPRFGLPFDFPMLLSANFGELRPNHFHGGLDIKTQGTTGHPVHAVADGYVSRVSVSPSGYGNALYVTHPSGYTSVYGHLDSFSPALARYVREQQYRQESFSVNLFPDSTLFRVREGDVIARSGNTGSSGGPHLHLEIRRTDTNEMVDPMPFYMSHLRDTRRPLSRGVMLYARPGEGVINGSARKQVFQWAQGGRSLTRRVEAWGTIGVAIRANDYMTGTTNVYGVRSVRLLVDSVEVFRSLTDRVAFDENRAINGFIDYDTYQRTRALYAKSYLLPGSRLRLTQSDDPGRGWVRIDEERDYRFTYELEDAFGNRSIYAFTVHGRPQPVPEAQRTGNELLRWDAVNTVTRPGMQLVIPRGMLYEDVDADVQLIADSSAIAFTYQLADCPVPLHGYCPLRIGVRRMPVADSTKYYIAERSGKSLWYVGGGWKDGWLEGRVRALGTYTVAIDTVAPTIAPLNRNQWSAGRLTFRVGDDRSGIKTYRATVDGCFVLFACNSRYNRLTCNLRETDIERGTMHTLELTVTDRCGNVEVWRGRFRY